MIAAAAVVSLVEVVEAAASVLSFEEKTVESNNTSEFHVNGRCHIKTSTSDASNVFGGGL